MSRIWGNSANGCSKALNGYDLLMVNRKLWGSHRPQILNNKIMVNRISDNSLVWRLMTRHYAKVNDEGLRWRFSPREINEEQRDYIMSKAR